MMGEFTLAESSGVRVSRYLQRGSIDYKAALLKLQAGIQEGDLEPFRRNPSEQDGPFAIRVGHIRDGQCHQARWKQDGFDVRAMVIANPDGWFDTGIFMYGKFADHWEAGAVRHWQGNERTYPWFIPSDPNNRHAYYRRACDYGNGWSYVGIKLIVSLHGVTLATETRMGIESDAEV